MTKKLRIGAALVALAILPVAVVLLHVNPVMAVSLAIAIGPALAGTVLVTYASGQKGNF